jgi:hypothetical protein
MLLYGLSIAARYYAFLWGQFDRFPCIAYCPSIK